MLYFSNSNGHQRKVCCCQLPNSRGAESKKYWLIQGLYLCTKKSRFSHKLNEVDIYVKSSMKNLTSYIGWRSGQGVKKPPFVNDERKPNNPGKEETNHDALNDSRLSPEVEQTQPIRHNRGVHSDTTWRIMLVRGGRTTMTLVGDRCCPIILGDVSFRLSANQATLSCKQRGNKVTSRAAEIK